MNPPEPNKELFFEQCLEHPETDRKSFLQYTCGGNVALVKGVETLLKSLEMAGGFFDTILVDDPADITDRLEKVALSGGRRG